MLTLKKIGITVGAGAQAMAVARYALEFADSPQAFERDGEAGSPVPANAVWVGSDSALELLGLERGTEVTAEQLALALQGLHTETGAEVRRPGYKKVPVLEDGEPVLDAKGKPLTTTEPQVNSVDLTFSAPKSVSVVWSQAGPELRREIEQAMLDAANGALEYMVRTKRVVQKDGGEVAVGFAASASLHVIARTAKGDVAPAPHLHVHSALVGVEALGEDQLRSPGTGALFGDDAPLAGGALFRAVLADRLRRIGFGIEARTGRDGMYFEIAGVKRGLIDRMSPRAREVERERVRRELAKGERLTGAALAAVALETRGAKTDIPAEVTIATWRAQCEELEYEEGTSEALARWDGPAIDKEELLAEARAGILERIWERGPTVSSGELEAIAYAMAPLDLSLDDVFGLLRELEASGELIALDAGAKITADPGQGAEGPEAERRVRVTTRKIRSLEEQVVRIATEAASRPSTPLSKRARAGGKKAADRALGKGASLDPEQVAAFEALTDGKGWANLTGLAGTGKGPVLQAVAEAHRLDGWQVIACAVDNANANQLGHQIGAPALTIEKVMRRLESEPESAPVSGRARRRSSRKSLEVDDRTLILIEEASKVGLVDWVRIAGLVKKYGARVVAVGHTGQLGAIHLPGMFAAFLKQKAIRTLKLTEVRRHDPPWMSDYNKALDTGTPKAAEYALKLLRENKAIGLYGSRLEAIAALIKDWDEHRTKYKDPRSTIIAVHGSNEDVDLLNELAQRCRLDTNRELPGPGLKAPDRRYSIYTGDVVMIREAAHVFEPNAVGVRERRVENATIGIVDSVDVDADRVRVRVQEPGHPERVVEIDVGSLRDRTNEDPLAALRLAYAFHPFPLQGATVKAAFVLEGDGSQMKEATYVADTRPKERLRKYVDRESLGTERTEEECWEQYLKRITTSQNRSASIVLDPSDEGIAPELPYLPPAGRELHDARVPAVPGSFVDPIAAHRAILGSARTRKLEERAQALGEWLGKRDEAWLRERRAELGDPFEQLDQKHVRAAFREVLRLERDKRLVVRKMREALRQADELNELVAGLEQRGSKLKGRGRLRKVKHDLLDEAETRREIAKEDWEKVQAIAADEERLQEQGLHPDDWLKKHGDRAARVAAIEREIASRELERAVARGVAEPQPGDHEVAVEPHEPAVEM